MTTQNIQIAIATRKYSYTLLAITLSFIATHCALNYYNHEVEEVNWLIFQLFDLDEENNLPTWFSSFLLLNSSLVLYLFARINRHKNYFHWMLLSIGFLLQYAVIALGILAAVNVASVIAIWWDKRRASKGRWRIREETLLVWALVGGWPGGIWAMRRFRHKVSKRSFIARYVLAVSLNLAALAAIGYATIA